MATYTTTLTPINGKEARELLINSFLKEIEKVPYMREGLAFKQIKLHYRMFIECYPEDCPCPAGQFQLLLGLDEGDDVSFDKDVKKYEILKEKLATILDNAKRIQSFLTKNCPQFDKIIDLEDDGIPDELRIAHGLKIPVVTTRNGKSVETRIDASQLKTKVN